MHPVVQLLLTVLNIYMWIVIVMVVMSWLIAFNIVNPNNRIVYQINYAIYRLTEPVFRPIRRVLPDLGGIDLSPMVVLIGIFFAKSMIIYYLV